MIGALRAIVRLLSPRVIGARNTLVRSERRVVYIGLLFVGIGFWAGLFGLMYFLVGRFSIVGDLAPLLADKVLEMLLSSLFVLLSFSNVITAFSTYFLSEDLALVLGLPISRTTFHQARFLDTFVQSSWMMALFGLPVFLAYGARMHGGPAFYLAVLVAIPALLVIATNLGIVVATVLVNRFDARRIREGMVLVGLVLIAALFVLVRSLRPERLANSEELQSLAEYMVSIRLPQPVLFPPRWVAEILSATLNNQRLPWMEIGLLATGALASAAVARWTVAWGFESGWSRSQEARDPRFYRSRWFDRLVAPLPASWRGIASKELRVFTRDPSQWSQVFLLLGMCAVYLVSVRSFPLADYSGFLRQLVQNVLAFVSLGMGGFVMAGIAARFQFTAVSREGRAWWVMRGAPVNPATVLRAKGILGILPMLLVGMVMALGGGILLDVPWQMLLFEAVTIGLLAHAISGLALALGALWPDFRADNAARAASSPAAVFFMVSALALISLVLSLEGAAVWMFLRTTNPSRWLGLVPAVLAVGICLFTGQWPVRRAAEALWSRGL